ncbi:MAG: alcohol dehydrogenase catalytic domain-containing protein [Candidatus Latescibacteria bacterium]|nr:alcohol dehydrogenase catalytic domain-containing protein [Candidatus Latescibacterota bacterium]
MARSGRSAILDRAKGTFTIEQETVPQPGPDELLIKQSMCGLCGTDVHIFHGHFPQTRFPLVLGHEIVGRIEKLGEDVLTDTMGTKIEEGDMIGIVPGMPCGSCYFCAVQKEPGLCTRGAAWGFRPFTDQAPHFQGGFSQYVLLNHPRNVFLKVNSPPEISVLLEPFTIGIHFADRANIQIGSTVVIQGAGAIGIFSLAAALEAGAHKTIVIGAPASRLALAKEFGADVTINIEEMTDPKQRIEAVLAETPGGYGADAVFECTGVPQSIPEGIDMLRRGGTYVEGGHFTNAGDVTMNPFRHFVMKNINLVGVWGRSLSHFVRGLPILESGRYPFDKMVSHQVPLERLGDAVNTLSTDYRFDGEEVRKIAITANEE